MEEVLQPLFILEMFRIRRGGLDIGLSEPPSRFLSRLVTITERR
jgi:hypothetical protein